MLKMSLIISVNVLVITMSLNVKIIFKNKILYFKFYIKIFKDKINYDIEHSNILFFF